jgi:plasmid stabilization system protein ParE
MLPDPIVTPEAEARIQRIDPWWRAHRLAAPDLFQEELADAFLTIRRLPKMGTPVRHPTVKGDHRVLRRAARYHAYCFAHGDTVFILAVWKAVRGAGPPLSAP